MTPHGCVESQQNLVASTDEPQSEQGGPSNHHEVVRLMIARGHDLPQKTEGALKRNRCDQRH